MEIRVHIAVLVVAADPARADHATADLVADKAAGAGHAVVARATVGDSEAAIRAQLEAWIADPAIDVVIAAAAPDSQHASGALKPLVTETVPGFTDLFRWLAFQEIGASAMLASAEAARCSTTFVFVLPAAVGTVGTAMDKLILPQLDPRTTPRNLVAQMPRLQPYVPAAPVVADGADQTEAVPAPVMLERTESGPGLVPRLPAPHVVRKESAPKPLAPAPEERTRIISPDQLENKIRQSNEHDAVTKPNVEIAKLLPRVPPGADDTMDDETIDIANVLSPQPFARAKGAADRSIASAGEAGARAKTPTPARVLRKPPTVQIPARTKPVTATPIDVKAARAAAAAAAVPAPTKDAKSAPTMIPIARMAEAAGMPLTQPPVRSADAHADTEEAPLPNDVAAEPSARADTIEQQMEMIEQPIAESVPASIRATGSSPVLAPGAPRAADASSSGSRPTTLDDSNFEEISEPPPPPKRATTPPPLDQRVRATTPPPKRVGATTPPPVPLVAEVRARMREPTPLPLLPKRIENDLPQGKVIFTTQKRHTGRNVAIFLALAVAAAGGGIAFVHFVLERPTESADSEHRTGPRQPEVAQLAAAPLDAAGAPTVAPDADIPEIDIEVDVGSGALPPELPEQAPVPPTHAPAGGHHAAGPGPTHVGAASPGPNSSPTSAVDAGVAMVAAVPIDAELFEDGCDEVSCVTSHYEKACCARWKPSEGSYVPHVGGLETLDKVMVREAIENVKPRVIACGEKMAAKGIVKLAIAVRPDGGVKTVSVVESPLAALGECVAAAVKEASFAKTVKGGAFNYPFSF